MQDAIARNVKRNDITTWTDYGRQAVLIKDVAVRNNGRLIVLVVESATGKTQYVHNAWRNSHIKAESLEQLRGKRKVLRVSRDERTGTFWCYL